MKRATFTEEQIIGALKKSEAGAKTANLARRYSVSEAPLYNWNSDYGGPEVCAAHAFGSRGQAVEVAWEREWHAGGADRRTAERLSSR